MKSRVVPSGPGAKLPGQKGWFRDHLPLFFAGLLLAASHPVSLPTISNQVGFVLDTPWQGLLAWVAIVPLVVRLLGAPDRSRVFSYTFVYVFACQSLSIYWLNVAIILYGGIHWTISVLAVTSLVLWITLMAAFCFSWGSRALGRLGLPLAPFVPLFWVAQEYLRNYIFNGFPWSQIGYSQARILPLLQSADLWGVYGMGLLLLWVNTALALLWLRARGRDPWAGARWRRPFVAGAGAVFLLALVYGAVQMHRQGAIQDRSPSIPVAVLQGNINQEIKNRDHLHKDLILARYQKLLLEADKGGPALILWPEAAFPGLLPAQLNLAQANMNLPFPLPGHTVLGSSVLFGKQDDRWMLGNSAFLISPQGQVLDRHDKTQLVPFGEYVPLPWLFKRLGARSVVQAMGNFTPGQAGHLLRFTSAPDGAAGALPVRAGALVCYEGVFPEISRHFANEGANLLLNLTNDGWYGISSAASQHLLMYAFRAVENRRAVVRAANTGISAFIDSVGRIGSPTPLYQTTFIAGRAPLREGRTLYNRLGDLPGYGSLLAWLFLCLAGVAKGWLMRKKGK